MSYDHVVLAVALQRYLVPPPVAVRAREIGIAIAKGHNASVDVIAVDAPVALLPGVESTQEKLSQFIAPIRAAGLDAHAHHFSGKPSERILEFLATMEPATSLLLIGSHSKRGPLDLGLGSTATTLARESPCPVLMVWPTLQEFEQTKELMIPGYPFVFPYG